MDVLSCVEQNDGSALLELDLTDEERDILISRAVNDILREYIEKVEREGIE